jgi:DNA (cytosine-5)-methyltransferase 1
VIKYSLSMFSGIGGERIGLNWANYINIGSIENEPNIAALYKTNFGTVIQEDATTCNPLQFKKDGRPLHLLWASPSCKSFSQANVGGKESDGDLALAEAICRFITKLSPIAIAIENVPDYRSSESIKKILSLCILLGYHCKMELLLAQDFGLPQNRERFIFRAIKKDQGELLKIKKSHAGNWTNWYDATAHLVPFLKKSTLKEIQLEAIELVEVRPEAIASPILLRRPMLVQRWGERKGKCWVKFHNELAPTVMASMTTDRKDPRTKAEKLAGKELTFTTDGHERHEFMNVWIPSEGQAYSVNIKFLASLQGFPDDYIWTGDKRIDGSGIGNAVPPQMAEAVGRSFKFN